MEHKGKLTKEMINRIEFVIEVREIIGEEVCYYYYFHDEELANEFAQYLWGLTSTSKVEMYKI